MFNKGTLIKFLTITFLWSYPLGIIAYGLFGDKSIILRYIFAVLYMMGPAIGAFSIGLHKNKDLMKLYFGKMSKGLVVGLSILVILQWGAPVLYDIVFHDSPIVKVIPSDYLITIVLAFTIGYIGAFGEEFGWRGFLIEYLRSKMPLIQSVVILGLIWGVWHFPVALGRLVEIGVNNGFNSTAFLGTIKPVMISCFSMIGASIAMSLIFTAIWSFQRNIKTVTYFHGFHNGVRDSLNLVTTQISQNAYLVYSGLYGLIILIAIIRIIYFNAKNINKLDPVSME